MGYSEHEFRKMDEAFCAANEEALAAPAVGGIAWTTCLVSTPTGPCLKGVQFAVRGAPTGRTKCDEHAAVDAMVRERFVDQFIADIAGTLAVINVPRDGVKFDVPSEIIWERARAIAAAILGNYEVTEIR